MICILCGKEAGAGSMGGRNICCWCDCGTPRPDDGAWDFWQRQQGSLRRMRENVADKPHPEQEAEGGGE
jgi:hypothetical protein